MYQSMLVRSGRSALATFFAIVAVALVGSSLVAPSMALAAAGVAPASDGTNISIDTTSAIGGTSTFSDLSGPAITENVAGDIVAGTHTIALPSGWEFDTTSNITIFKFSGNIVLGPTSVTPGPTSFSFVVNSQSTSASVLGFSGLKVRPTVTNISEANGNMTHSGASILGVDGSTNFGTLSTIASTVTKLAFTTQPGDAEYGSLLDAQPVIVTQDQFGNDSTSGLAANLDVTLTLTTGTGALVGDATLDIGTGAGNGTVTFTDLTVDEFGAGKQLTASATGLTSAVSDDFEIEKKSLTATITVVAKDYDSDNTVDTITSVDLAGVVEWDSVEDAVSADFSAATATFASENAGTQAISVTGVVLAGADKDNYTLADVDVTGTGTINPLEITVTPDVGQSKV